MNRHYHTEIENLRSRLILAGQKTAEIYKVSLKGLTMEQLAYCDLTETMQEQIDSLEAEIVDEALRYISLRAPVAKDLRLMIMVVQSASSFGRIAYESVQIARNTRVILKDGRVSVSIDSLMLMADGVLETLEKSISGFLTEQVSADIDEGGENFSRWFERHASQYTSASKEKPGLAETYIRLSLVAKSILEIGNYSNQILKLMERFRVGEDNYQRI